MKLRIVFSLAHTAVVLALGAAAWPAGEISRRQNALAPNLSHSTPANQ